MVYGSINNEQVCGVVSPCDITRAYAEERYWKITGNNSQWTDIRLPATAAKQGSNSKPVFDYTNLGAIFPQNDESHIIYELCQFGHDRTPDSSISPHIHYIQSTSTPPTFKMEYRWYENGAIVPNFTTIEASTGIFPYSGSPILQIMEFPDISGTNHSGLSSMMDIKLYRKTGDGVAGDVLVKEFDIHFQVNSAGSTQEYIK